MFEKTKMLVYDGPADRYATLVTLPGDIGEEQLLLGCLPTVQAKDGRIIPCDFHYCRGKREGNIYAELIVDRCPAEFTVSLKFILLLAPVLSNPQQEEIAQTLAGTIPRPPRARRATAGFPSPEFVDGGPAFLGLGPGKTEFDTIDLVLRKVRELVEDSVEPQFATNMFVDPDLIKKVGKGGCVQRSRLAEKALAGVARASFVVAFRDGIDPKDVARYPGANSYPGLGHAFVVIEDPETGKYLFADPSKAFPYLGPHPGNVIVERVLELEDHTLSVPSNIPWPIGKSRMLVDLNSSSRRLLRTSNVLYTASSRYGREKDKYRVWLQNAPAEFRRLADNVNRKHANPRGSAHARSG